MVCFHNRYNLGDFENTKNRRYTTHGKGENTFTNPEDFEEWYNNMTDFGLRIGVIIPPPDKNWKANKEKSNGL